MSVLSDFLQRNTVPAAGNLPLVHSASAYEIKKYMQSGIVPTHPCDVYLGENLQYYFVGRPAYKKNFKIDAEYWEFPSCLILNYNAVKPKRIYPFDTGAFKGGLFPEFITMMEMDEFEMLGNIGAVEKLIGAFFVDRNRYFQLKPRSPSDFSHRFNIDVIEEELKALHSLILTKSERYDDRRFSIEVQTEEALILNQGVVLAVVFPDQYADSNIYMSYIKDKLKAVPLPYCTFPARSDLYYYAIYEQVYSFFKSTKVLR